MKARNQRTYLLRVDHPANPRPLQIELMPRKTALDGLRRLAPEAIARIRDEYRPAQVRLTGGKVARPVEPEKLAPYRFERRSEVRHLVLVVGAIAQHGLGIGFDLFKVEDLFPGEPRALAGEPGDHCIHCLCAPGG